ncbi:MAG: hypothetical protein R3C26_11185 [Calditrichia bacterium]
MPTPRQSETIDRNVLVEDWGGQYGCVEVSAKSGKGVPELLDRILLEAELLDLKGNPKKRAKGVVLEAQLDRVKEISRCNSDGLKKVRCKLDKPLSSGSIGDV